MEKKLVHMGVPQKIKNKTAFRASNPASACMFEDHEIWILKRRLHSVHRSINHDRQGNDPGVSQPCEDKEWARMNPETSRNEAGTEGQTRAVQSCERRGRTRGSRRQGRRRAAGCWGAEGGGAGLEGGGGGFAVR